MFEYLGDHILESIIILGVVLLMWGIVLGAVQDSRDAQAAYSGWVKLTGNEKALTFEEWRSLNAAENPKARTTIMYMPVHSGR
jgi:heme A synthase